VAWAGESHMTLLHLIPHRAGLSRETLCTGFLVQNSKILKRRITKNFVYTVKHSTYHAFSRSQILILSI
jgi:hypothetical protein